MSADKTALRSIPACAGEPSRPWRTQTVPMVYPRVCGGTRSRCCPIPACAGEPAPNHRVYPRVCGGTPPSATMGLSPRVRGNPLKMLLPRLSPRVRGNHGSIPACAGEPPPISIPRCAAPNRGLSPRVRGNRCEVGSIPACAGEPSIAISP